MLNRPDKNALRALLESRVQKQLRLNPDAVTTYAAKPEPERKAYTSKRTVQDNAFGKELEQMRADVEAGLLHQPVSKLANDDQRNLTLDDYTGFTTAGT